MIITQLIQAYSKLIVVNTDAELDCHLIYSSFAALSARGTFQALMSVYKMG